MVEPVKEEIKERVKEEINEPKGMMEKFCVVYDGSISHSEVEMGYVECYGTKRYAVLDSDGSAMSSTTKFFVHVRVASLWRMGFLRIP